MDKISVSKNVFQKHSSCHFVFILVRLLSISISSISISSISSVGQMGGFHRLADSLRDLVVDIATGHLGHQVAVFNLNWNSFDLGVVNTVLGGHITTSMLDSSGDRVGNSSSNWGNMVSSITSEILGISLGISFTLANGMISRSITNGVSNLLADLLVLNLLGVYNSSGANILSGWNTSLGDQNLQLSLAVGGWDSIGGGKELGISLSFGSRGGASKGKKASNGKNLEKEILLVSVFGF